MNVPGTELGILHDCLLDPHNSPMKEEFVLSMTIPW